MRFVKSFTTKIKSVIISIVKANKVFTIALACVCGASILSVGSAFGAEEVKDAYYPDKFENTLTDSFGETSVRDFAVHGDTLAFAHSNFVYVLYTDTDNDERQLQKYQHASGITAIEYNAEGKLYFKDATEVSYLYTMETKAATAESHDFTNLPTYNLTVDGTPISYTLDKLTGELRYGNDGVWTTVSTGGDSQENDRFTLLKQCGEKIYAIKDNIPYSLDGGTATKVDDLHYTDFSEAKNLPTGNAAQKLKALKDEITTCEIIGNRFYTKLNKGEIGATFDTDVTARANGNITCQLLCRFGPDDSVAIVAIRNDYYVTASSNLTNLSKMQSNTDGKTYYAVSDVSVYSSPFMSESTKLENVTLKSGKEHPVKVLESYEHIVLNATYCKVSFKDENDNTVTGYVAANFLNLNDFAADDFKPENKGEDNFSYDTNVPTVLLTILIVGLVIIAAMYLFLVFTKKDKTQKVKKEKKKKQVVERTEIPEDDYDE